MAKVLNLKTNTGKLGYTIYEREDESTGSLKSLARLVPYSKFDELYINKWAAQFMKVSEAQMRMAFNALADAVEYFVLNGHSVTLKNLGNFTFSTKSGIWNERTQKWTSAGKENAADCQASDIKGTYIRIRLCTELREKLGATQLYCVDDTTFGEQEANSQAGVRPTNP
ncbi:MAG: hypothetical protein J6X27_00465 [Bacteroidaceae bacterium]|nr:hypothetical protein [Bacteroidaceae bacterium]